MIHHHPSAEMLLSYAAGNLTEGFSMAIASHASMCADCRRRLHDAESVGGALLYAMEPTAVADDTLDKVLARIDAGDTGETDTAHSELPEAVRTVLSGSYQDLPWRILAPGMKHIVLPLESKGPAKARLLRLAPGIATPSHSHKGQEVTLVLKGSFSDELGRYAPGDMQETDPSINHQPIADTGEDCICLVVTDAPLKFDNLVGKILQPIFGY